MTITEAKEQAAKESGYSSWYNCKSWYKHGFGNGSEFNQVIDRAIILYHESQKNL